MDDRALLTVHISLFRRDRPLITPCTSHSRRSLYRALLTEDRARVTEDKALLTEYRALLTVHTSLFICTRTCPRGSFKL